jgi:hypothetical protein
MFLFIDSEKHFLKIKHAGVLLREEKTNDISGDY